jgi:aspartate-semialdehyde dehydrogenase
MIEKIDVAIIGATGMVGTAMLAILEERNFPIKNLYLVASKRSMGETREFFGKSLPIHNLTSFDFSQTKLCFFCAGNDITAEYAPIAAKQGNIVIDKSSCFRNDPDVPLVIPEVNPEALKFLKNKNIIASPNCSTIPIVMALKPIYDAFGITRINVATYQSVSGTGKDAVRELADQTALLLNGKTIKPKVYPQQIAFNVLPHCDDFQENGYTKEEMKVVWETQKILNDNTLAINPTAVRVPVFYGHSAAVNIETKRKIKVEKAIELLSIAPGIKLNKGKFPYATPVQDAAGEDAVFVGRIREDISCKNGLNLWVVSDNIRKGAALNAIQIAETLIAQHLLAT